MPIVQAHGKSIFLLGLTDSDEFDAIEVPCRHHFAVQVDLLSQADHSAIVAAAGEFASAASDGRTRAMRSCRMTGNASLAGKKYWSSTSTHRTILQSVTWRQVDQGCRG